VRKLFAAATTRTESLPFTTGPTGIVPVDATPLSIPFFGTTRMTAPLPELTRRVGWNALLWTAGNLLTTGGFLTYFVREYRPPGLVMTVLLIVPETAAILGLSTPWILAWTGDRRRIWWVGQVVARLLTLCVPVVCAILGPREAAWAGWAAIALVGGAAIAQSVSYNALFSWLADLAPREQWGRVFALRQTVQVVLLLCLAAPAGWLRDWVSKEVNVADRWLIYAPLFAVGVGLQLLALVPLWSLRDERRRGLRADDPQPWLDAFPRSARVWRWLLANWWLAFFSGLTQSAFFKYRVDVLAIGLGTYYLLEAAMRGVQIPASLWAGSMSDRGDDLRAFRWGVAGTGLALAFWMLATPERWWWLYGAQVAFGMWAFINLAGPNLTLRLAPEQANVGHLAWFHNGSGLLAGLAGLAGGVWLDEALRTGAKGDVAPFMILFTVSMLGRWATLAWLPSAQAPPTSPGSGR
jgi:hypothetical protein